MALTPETLYDQAQESLAAIRAKTDFEPEVGIVLGTGLGGLVEAIEVVEEIPYSEIPHVPPPTVLSHEGRMLLGTLGGRKVAALQGRFHLYEGYTPLQVTFPVRLLKLLGAGQLFLSNACGGMNPQYKERDLMLIADHVHLQGENPLIGHNDDRFGPRFVDLLDCYSPRLRKQAKQIAREEKIHLNEGVYSCVTGPNLETRAEYRMLRWTDADVVGMSTVPEVLVARHMGMEVFACSVVTDLCFPEALEVAEISKIIANAEAAEPALTKLMSRLIAEGAPEQVS